MSTCQTSLLVSRKSLWNAWVSSSFLEHNSVVRCKVFQRHWTSFLAQRVTWNINPENYWGMTANFGLLICSVCVWETLVPTRWCNVPHSYYVQHFSRSIISRLWNTLTSTITRAEPPHFFLWVMLKAPPPPFIFHRHIQQHLRSRWQRFGVR